MMIDVLGIPSHVEQFGQGEEHVILLHGWGEGVTLDRHLRPLALQLANEYRVTALEFPAHGASGKPKETWGVENFALWVEAAMMQLGIPGATLIAHSFGGRISLWLAANRPQLVKRMVLTGAAGLKKQKTDEQLAADQRYQRQKEQLAKAEKLPLVGSLAQGIARKLRDKRSSADYLAADEDIKPTFVRIVSEDLGPLLPRVSQPTLLIWGENDDATPLWMGQRMEKEISDAALITFPGRGHFAYLEELPRFGLIAKAFIAEDAKKRV